MSTAMADVRLRRKDGKAWIEIGVDAYPSPISYKGQYHYRSGSTKQELKGTALEQFLLKKRGRTWDGVSVPGVTVSRLDRHAFRRFRELAREAGGWIPHRCAARTPCWRNACASLTGATSSARPCYCFTPIPSASLMELRLHALLAAISGRTGDCDSSCHRVICRQDP